MAPTPFDRGSIDAFLDAAAERLSGEWVVVGASAAAAWFLPGRVTQDLAMVPADDTSSHRLDLMDLAAERGLPIESVNSAAGWFLRRIDGWRDELEILRSGRATIFRPNATLFLLLKAGRLSESDLGDCLALLDAAETHRWDVDRARVREAIASLGPGGGDASRQRRAVLLARL